MKKDWVGTWFELIEKRGFQTDVFLGTVKPGSTQATPQIIQWRRYSHAQYDGVGVILDHLRSEGLNPTVPLLPQKFYGTWWSRLRGIFANLRFIPVFGAQWKKMAPASSADPKEGQRTCKILSREQTQVIASEARKAGVSVNSYLLWTLDQSLRHLWIQNSGPFYWMIPVNMRGASKKAVDTSNHASWIWVDTLGAKAPLEIQNQIQERFREGFHWGAWLALNIGRLIRVRGMNFFLDKAQHIEEHWVGTFSNVGAWNVEADPVAFVVPTAPSTPLSAGCVTVNGQMCLSLHIHPRLKLSATELETCLQDWQRLALRTPSATVDGLSAPGADFSPRL